MGEYTYQTHSDSGSFAAPDGSDIEHAQSVKELHAMLTMWAYEHGKVGADNAAAYLLVWKGRHEDVTDVYPDMKCRLGPREGLQQTSV